MTRYHCCEQPIQQLNRQEAGNGVVGDYHPSGQDAHPRTLT